PIDNNNIETQKDNKQIIIKPTTDETISINEYQDIINEHMESYRKGQRHAFKRNDVLKSLYNHGQKRGMKGDGLFSWIKRGYMAVQNFLSGPRKGYSARMTKFLAANGDKQIWKMEVVRKPI